MSALPPGFPGGALVYCPALEERLVPAFDRITLDPDVMGGKPCIRGIRVTVGTVLGLLASGHTEEEILEAYPYLEKEDIRAALAYATWRVEEIEVVVAGG